MIEPFGRIIEQRFNGEAFVEDALVVVIVVVLSGAAALLVMACDKIVGHEGENP